MALQNVLYTRWGGPESEEQTRVMRPSADESGVRSGKMCRPNAHIPRTNRRSADHDIAKVTCVSYNECWIAKRKQVKVVEAEETADD